MAFNKAHLYPADLQRISQKMKTMAYPARLQTLFFLLENGPSCVQDIAHHHHISKEALSGHLSILRKGQLVSCMERYPYTFYQPDRKNFRKTIKEIRACLDRLEQML